MVFWTSLSHPAKNSSSIESNETYRSKNGFKELDVHNNPQRRNSDFKPMLYGDFIGMLNFKLSEPWALLRHLPDLVNETHQKPIQWIKWTLSGAFYGFFYGIMSNTHLRFGESFTEQKLHLSNKKTAFNFSTLRTTGKMLMKPMGNGAGIFLAFKLLHDFFEHHTEGQDIPEIFIHFKSFAVMTPFIVSYFLPMKHVIAGSVAALGFGFPIYWLFRSIKSGEFSEGNKYYFYQDGVTEAEQHKFEHQDRIEAIGLSRGAGFSYGSTRNSTYFLPQNNGK